MNVKTFIGRPVLAGVISTLIVIVGVIGLLQLPIEQFPDIAPPTVRVSATYTGANAETVLKSVIVPLEESLNGVKDMGTISLNVQTAAGSSLAQTDSVMDKVEAAIRDIPEISIYSRVSGKNARHDQSASQAEWARTATYRSAQARWEAFFSARSRCSLSCRCCS